MTKLPRKVAKIILDEGIGQKYEMGIFETSKITIRRVAKNASTILFKGDIKELMYLLWRNKK